VDNIATRFVQIESGVLRELNSPEEFYQLLLQDTAATGKTKPTEQNTVANVDASSEDELLQQLIALEDKLAADLARKPKFQKPARQAEWQQQIEQLQAQLDNLGD
jgi:hypothetical protein